MIKDVEIAMVHAANYALEYQDKKYNADIEEIIKQFLNKFNYLYTKSKLKIYSVAAISEVLKLKRDKNNRNLNNKQLMQMFTNKIPEIVTGIDEQESE
jgi:hypothetical protein